MRCELFSNNNEKIRGIGYVLRYVSDVMNFFCKQNIVKNK